MSDVSCKVIQALMSYADSRRFALQLEQIEQRCRQEQFLPWSDFPRVCEAISSAHGSDDWVRDFARQAISGQTPMLGNMFKITRYVAGPKWLYWAMHRWVVPANFHNISSSFEDLGNNRLKFRTELAGSCEDYPFFFRAGRINLSALPSIMGLPDAIVEADIGPRSATYTITLPPSASLWSRILHAIRIIFSTRMVTEYTANKDWMLEKSYRDLLESQGELQQIRMSLEQKVAERTEQLRRKVEEIEATEQQLRSTEQYYRQIVETAPCVIWILGKDGRFALVNEQITSIYGFSMAEVIGQPFADFIAASDRPKVVEAFHSVLQGGLMHNFEFQIVGKNGDLIDNYTNAKPLLDKNGQIIGITGTSVDITDKKLADKKIRENEALLIRAQEIARFGYWTWNIATSQIHWSDEVFRIFGHDPQSFTVTYDIFLSFLHPDDSHAVTEALGRSIGQKSPYCVEHRIVRPDGQIRHLLEQAETTYSATGEPLLMIGTVQDITERKVNEQRLIEAKEAADAANRAKSTFLANMSHELRTPLGAILGFAELLAQKNIPDKDRLQFVEIVMRNGRHLVALIDDLLDVAKIEARRLDVALEPVNPGLILRQVVELLLPEAAGKHLGLRIEGAEELPLSMVSDPTKLRQIFTNIIGNAIKFTDHGKVRITCSMTRIEAGGRLNFLISDTGKGISEVGQKTLFAPFSQEDVSTTRKYGGTGLGLYLSRKLAVLLGGDVILVASEENKGSSFLVTIPVAPSGSDQRQSVRSGENTQEMPVSHGALQQKHLLLIEDYTDNQILIKTILERAGCKVEIAGTGSVGLSMASRQTYDAIIMDMQLPELDGFTLTRTLRQNSVTIPIIALTAFASSEDRKKCLAAGCNDFLAKPLQEELLLSTLCKWL